LYALADLTPGHSDKAEWYAPDESGRCAVLVYRGFGRPIFLDSGDLEQVRRTIPGLAAESRFYLSVRPASLALLEEAGYAIPKPKRMLRMRLGRRQLRIGAANSAVRLSLADLERLQALYADGDARSEAPEFFLPSMLDSGVYFGALAGDGLAAVAGTHVFAPEHDVAGVGNIYTRWDLRRQGFARQATMALVEHLIERDVGVICLNVGVENAGAIALYRELGFQVHCEYFEGEAVRF
jgi:ribosomal protein S18 acetylase RimI-like enzyme